MSAICSTRPLGIVISLLLISLNTSLLNGQSAAPAANLRYNDAFSGDVIMTRVSVPITAAYTYDETMGWNWTADGAGYCGIQDNSSQGKNLIFSLWDPVSVNGQAQLVYASPGGTIGRQTNEGSGWHYFNYTTPWNVNQWYRLVSRAWDYDGQTYFAMWYYDETAQVWTHEVTFSYPVAGVRFNAYGASGTISFIEDFGDSGQNIRRVEFNDGWKRTTGGTWFPFTSAQFGLSDSIPVQGPYYNAYDAGVQNGSYYLQTGGNTQSTTAPGSTLTLANANAALTLTVGENLSATAYYDTPSNQLMVSWVADPKLSPPFTYKVEIFDNAGLNGTPVAALSDTMPHARSVVFDIRLRPETSYYARVTTSDIFDQPAVPITAPVVSESTRISGYVFVANTGSNTISGYGIDATTGALTPTAGSPFSSEVAAPFSLALPASGHYRHRLPTPAGRFLYVASHGDARVGGFAVDSRIGALSPIAGNTFSAGTIPISVAVDPQGRFAYVANAVSGDVSAFAVDPGTGTLAEIAGSPFAAGSNPFDVTIDPSGTFLYVANCGLGQGCTGTGSGNISAYRINDQTGVLTPVPGQPYSAGANPLAVAVEPNGHFVYVANTSMQSVSGFRINRVSGGLTPIPGSPFPAGSQPASMTFDPGGQFAYVANAGSNDVSVFTIDPETGGLTPKGTFSVGVTPLAVAIDPAGRFLYTTNAASSDISAFSVAPGSGLLTLVGTYSAGVRPSSIATVAAETVRPFLPVRGPAFWK